MARVRDHGTPSNGGGDSTEAECPQHTEAPGGPESPKNSESSGSTGSSLDLIARGVLAPIRAYQRWISPALPRSCRYYPTCSAYAVEAVTVHGALKGTLLAAWRLLRCNPLTPGGVDHVPDPGRWRYHHPHDVPRFEVSRTAG